MLRQLFYGKISFIVLVPGFNQTCKYVAYVYVAMQVGQTVGQPWGDTSPSCSKQVLSGAIQK